MFAPQTPLPTSSLERTFASSPLTSSPLAPPHSSPLDRLSRFKTQWHGMPSKARQPVRKVSRNGEPAGHSSSRGREEEPVKILWRERLEQRCRERAREDRRQARSRAWGSDGSDDMDAEDENEDYLDDELIRRVCLAEMHRMQRSQEYLFAREVGSSLDPDMYDIEALERETLERSDEPQPEEMSPPSSEDDDMDPSELYDAYIDELVKEGWVVEREAPPLSPLPPSSPPIYPEDDYDFDLDFDMDDIEPSPVEDAPSGPSVPATSLAGMISTPSCSHCGVQDARFLSVNGTQDAVSCGNCGWTSRLSHH